jgi:hypothetical protein
MLGFNIQTMDLTDGENFLGAAPDKEIQTAL